MKKTHLYIAAAGLALAAPVNAQTVNPPPAPQAPAAQVQAPTAPVQAPGGLPSANQFGVGPTLMPSVVVTATGYPTPVSQIASTIQVITQDNIAHSTAKSVADLLAQNAVGFMSQWTAGQTSINIRGGATEGQGRDFKSQVLVLINGHRAGQPDRG